MTNTSQIIGYMVKELEKSIYLPDEDKLTILEKIRNLPAPVASMLLTVFKQNNNLVDLYIDKAVQKEPAIIAKLKSNINQFRIYANNLVQSESAGCAESNLENALK
jgi:hypothetical protein